MNLRAQAGSQKRSKYESICELLLERYPEDVTTYQNKDQINKDRVAAKLKMIRAGFRKAVDAGKRSGGGRVVFTFFNLCESLWGGSPAVKSISNSIDTSTDRENPDDQHSENEDDNEALDGDSFNSSGNNLATTSQNNKSNEGALDRNAAAVLSDSEDLSESTSSDATAKRRKNVSHMLKNRKDQKLSSALSSEAQYLQLFKEDIALKRKLLEKMEKSDEDFKNSLASINNVMQSIGTAVQQSVGILAQTMTPPPINQMMRDFYPQYNSSQNQKPPEETYTEEQSRSYYNL